MTGCLALQACESNDALSDNEPALPSTVVVAFDQDEITPVIIEGVADRETGRLVDANDPVRVASISKLVMGLAALRLVEEGVVDLDVDVSTYLGWSLRAPGFPDQPVTLRHLLSHRAALRDDGGYSIPLGESLQDKLADKNSWVPGLAPGEAPFAYANLGSPVIATALEAASGERYDQLVERTVFAPLGIKACFNWIGCEAKQVENAVVLYRDTGEVAVDDKAGLPPACTFATAEGVACKIDEYRPGTNAAVFSPQGGLRIGMVDLAKLGQALASQGGGVFEPAIIRQMLVSAEPLLAGQEFFCGYGLGVQMIEGAGRECLDFLFEDGRARFGHPGEAYGLRSGLWFDPETGSGIAYYTTAVPDRQGSESEGGFSTRELDLIKRVQTILGQAEP